MKNAAATIWNEQGMCRSHGTTPNADGNCNPCLMGVPVSNLPALTGIALAWAKSTTARMQPGGDLCR